MKFKNGASITFGESTKEDYQGMDIHLMLPIDEDNPDDDVIIDNGIEEDDEGDEFDDDEDEPED